MLTFLRKNTIFISNDLFTTAQLLQLPVDEHGKNYLKYSIN